MTTAALPAFPSETPVDFEGLPRAPKAASNIAANGNNAVKVGAGRLFRITINKKGASSNVFTVYDGADAGGTKLATIDTTDKLGALEYDIPFATGLFIVSATGTCADATVIFT